METDAGRVAEKLLVYLRGVLGDAAIGYVQPPTRIPGGFETQTYRFQLRGVREEISRPLVLRLYRSFVGSRGAVWESTVQNTLAREGYPVAPVYWTCTDMEILGGAFFIMAFLPGELMSTAPLEAPPRTLGEIHAALHSIDPAPLSEAFREQGIEESRYRFGRQLEWLRARAARSPWLGEGVAWLLAHRPPEPARLAICHGDLHYLNILIQDGRVTGVLDWPGFLVADPVLDVAHTVLLTTIPIRHLAAVVLPGMAAVDWDKAAQLYLDAYRAKRALDTTYLDYYGVRRAVHALVQGLDGQQVWQHPGIVPDLIAYIERVTGIRMVLPERGLGPDRRVV